MVGSGVQAVALSSLPEAFKCQEHDVTSARAAHTHVPCHAHTCTVSRTPSLAWLQLFPLKSSKSFGDGGWMLAILRTPLLFILCVFWKQLLKYQDCWERTTFSGRLQTDTSGNVIFLKTLLELLRNFLASHTTSEQVTLPFQTHLLF